MPSLFDPFDLAGRTLRNRLVMAPMTRARAPDEIATRMTAEYYRQRAGAGLIVSEGTSVSPEARGFLYVPGIHTPAQVVGWRQVTQAVHAAGGSIFAQLWHVGRVSHVSLQEGRRPPVGPTAERGGAAFAYDEDGEARIIPSSEPRPLATQELPRIAEDFARAAANAIEAGFDGVEIHGANGYLFEQFLNPKVNLRSDPYGGGVEGRSRLLLETVQAVAARVGRERVGVRLSPYAFLFDMPAYDSLEADYLHVATELGRCGVAYLHLMDQGAVSEGFDAVGKPRIQAGWLSELRQAFAGALILTGGLDQHRALGLLDAGLIDLAGMGRPFIANPDLVERLRQGRALAQAKPEYFYGGDHRGYVDYPALDPAPHCSTSEATA